ncbi:MAG: tRNA pseudouridine(55) synthase TruB [Clostridia bacterium]|nr:tRNA pseudouridine(55) synthase TruB [Clostridia bacterium]
MDGFLNIEKEPGMTSFDVVAKVRKLFQTRSVGHTGTLDPNASGVLVVAVGCATKAISYLEQEDKVYAAELTLGIETDTEDIWGKTLKTCESLDTINLSEERIREVLVSFVGKIEQVPPMYSAIKINGKKLYELARAGMEVERRAREIEIFSIENISVNGLKVRFTVHCSKGTYIRTLCKDIGEKLGCGAVMSELVRLKAGNFALDSACKLGELEQNFQKCFVSIEEALSRFEKLVLTEEESRLYRNGVPVKTEVAEGRYRVYLEDEFYGICLVKDGVIRSEKKISGKSFAE